VVERTVLQPRRQACPVPFGGVTMVRILGLVACTLLLTGCSEPTQVDPVAPLASSAAAAMLGSWQYVSPRRPSDPPVLGVGLIVALTIDAVEDSSFRGSVDLWIAGDVGLAPDTFGPVSGTIGSRGHVTLEIPFRQDGRPPLELVGTVVTDTLTVEGSICGGEPGPFTSGSKFVRFTDQP
jgi:hypothetical protein